MIGIENIGELFSMLVSVADPVEWLAGAYYLAGFAKRLKDLFGKKEVVRSDAGQDGARKRLPQRTVTRPVSTRLRKRS